MLDHEFKLKPSLHYVAYIIILLIATGAIIQFLPIVIWLKLIGTFIIICYGLHVLWGDGLLRGPHAILALRYREGNWLVYTEQQIYRAELSGDSTVCGIVSVLRFRFHSKQRRAWLKLYKTCVVFPDSLSPNMYRQLLVVVRNY
jgi:hypothetical protein